MCDICTGKWFIPGKLSESGGGFDDYSSSLEERLWYVSMLWLSICLYDPCDDICTFESFMLNKFFIWHFKYLEFRLGFIFSFKWSRIGFHNFMHLFDLGLTWIEKLQYFTKIDSLQKKEKKETYVQILIWRIVTSCIILGRIFISFVCNFFFQKKYENVMA